MKYVVLFEDDPEVGSDVRRTYMSEHLAFLERSAEQVESAGPLRTTEGEGAGGIWIVEAESATTCSISSLILRSWRPTARLVSPPTEKPTSSTDFPPARSCD